MACTEAYKEHIMYTFNGFCKTVIRYAAINAWRDRSRQREIGEMYGRRRSTTGYQICRLSVEGGREEIFTNSRLFGLPRKCSWSPLFALDCGQPPSGHTLCPCPRLVSLPGLPCVVLRPVLGRLWRLYCAVSDLLYSGGIPGAGISAALAAFCAFMVSASSTSARSKSSPNFRTVMLPLWLCPSGWVHTRAWCPGKCSLQNCSPNCCARSTDSPWDFSFPPDFQAEQRRPRPPGLGKLLFFVQFSVTDLPQHMAHLATVVVAGDNHQCEQGERKSRPLVYLKIGRLWTAFSLF